MKNIGLSILAGLMIISCNQSPQQTNEPDLHKQIMAGTGSVRDGVFIHITESYNDPHRVLMPMKMATIMADDKDVIIYMDIHAVELLVKDAKDLKYTGFDSFQTYLKQLLDKGIAVYACPTCLKVAGFEPENLTEGVHVAEKDKFFNFTRGRILTLDY